MARKWIAKATADAHGQFAAKAKSAGMSTRAFATAHAGDSGRLGKQARLAQTLMGMHHKSKLKSREERMAGRYGKKD